MKKKIFALCTAMLLTAIMSMSAFAQYAETVHLVDNAELLTEKEAEKIENKLDRLCEEFGMDVVICTEEVPIPDADAMGKAMELYDGLGYADDGIMLYINMETRDCYVITTGYAKDAATDTDLIIDGFIEYLQDGEYMQAFGEYISQVDTFVSYYRENGEPYIPETPYNFFVGIGISLVVGFVISFIITGIWKSSLTSVARKTRASDYMRRESFNITASRDLFLYRNVVRRAKPKNTSGGGSSRTSSSGRSFSGGGRKF